MSQGAWQTVQNSRTGSSKAFVSEAVVRTWHRTLSSGQRKTKGTVGCLHTATYIISQITFDHTMPDAPNRLV